MKKNKLLKLMSIVLVVIMVVLCAPISVLAVDDSENTESEADQAQSTQIPSFDPEDYESEEFETVRNEVIGEVEELVSLREEKVKHFRLSDGSVQAVVYSEAVHRKDADGVWQDIDNRLSEENSPIDGLYATADMRVGFAEVYSPNQTLFGLIENGYTISMSLIENISSDTTVTLRPGDFNIVSTASVENAEARPSDNKWSTLDSAVSIDNASRILYNDIRTDTDLEYILVGNDVKENIIVHSATGNYVYSFELNVTGLDAILNDDGEVILSDISGDGIKYIIPAPYMYDANGERSDDVSYSLVNKGNGRYLLTVTANEEWIEDNERAFPVTIDPSYNAYNFVMDTYVDSTASTMNYGSSDYMLLNSNTIAYVIMSLPVLPTGATVNSARFEVSYYGNSSEGNITMSAYQVMSPWIDDEVTYNTRPTIGTTPLDTKTVPVYLEYSKYNPMGVSFTVTDLYRSWYSMDVSNYGIAIMRGPSSTTTVKLNTYDFDTMYCTYMTINYTIEPTEGVYAIKSYSLASTWMTVSGDGFSEGAAVQHKTLTSSPKTTFERESLFKISKKTSTGRFIIRSMQNNEMGISVSGSQVVLKKLPSDDNDVADADTFMIEWDGSGYRLRPTSAPGYAINITSTSTNLTTVTNGTAGSKNGRWTLEQYTGNHRIGSVISRPASWDSTGMVVEEMGVFQFYTWSTVINENMSSVLLFPDSEDMVDLSTDYNTGIHILTALYPGSVDMYLMSDGGNVAGQYSYMAVPQEGAYFINNRAFRTFIGITEEYSINESLKQYQYDASDLQKWRIEHVADSGGYVRIKSVYSNLYIGVDSLDTSVVKISNIQNDYSLWKIKRTTLGNFTIACKFTESSDLVLSLPLSTYNYGENLTQLFYANDGNLDDEWEINIVKDMSLIALPEDYDRTSFFEVVLSYGETMGYTDNYDNAETVEKGMKEDEFLNRLAYSKITVVRTHGGPNSITLTGGRLTTSDLQSLPAGALSYSEIVILGSCATAAGGEDAENLANAMVDAGARTVIGFQDSVNSYACNEWCKTFFAVFMEYRDDEQKTIRDVCVQTDLLMQSNPRYESINENGVIESSLRNYVICGEESFS